MGYRRHTEDNYRLRRIYYAIKHSYSAGVYYDTQKQRYIRFPLNRGSGYTKYLRRKKRVRKAQGQMMYGAYLRQFHYLWKLI